MVLPSSAWSDSQKSALVQKIVSGELNLEQACTAYGLSVDQIKDWVCIFRRSVRQAIDRQLRSTLSLQGLDVDELSRPEFSGEIADLDVADLVQTIQLGRKDATITITHGGRQSYIWCEGGEIVDAESGSLLGEPALFRILNLDQGSLLADFGRSGRARRVQTATPRLLLEAATQRDRKLRARQRIGDLRRVCVVVSSVAARHAADLGPEELAVLSAFDGSRTLEDVVVGIELPQHEVLEIAVRFLEQGVLSPASTQLALAEAPAPLSASNAGMAMSYQPLAGTLKPDHQRPPFWVLASGALLCSSLGAVTAIAYAVASDPALREMEAESPSAAARPVAVAPTAALPTVAPANGVSASAPSANAPVAVLAAPASCPEGMALIRGGKFFMGSDSSHPALQYAQPAHAVSLDTFCLGTREVSVSEYQECVSNGACAPAHLTSDLGSDDGETVSSASKQRHDEQCNAGKARRDHDPINCVSHGQAASYCAFLSGRLASEAEWEFAARGEANRRFPWGNTPATAEHANTCGKECARWHEEAGLSGELHGVMFDQDDGYAGTAPVGSYPAGATSDGVLDLIGNVFEWTSGGLYAYDHTPRNNPHGPSNGDSFVIRGGNFKSGTPEFSDPALRFAMPGNSYSHGVGFRCASDAFTPR
ncbi:MAG: hypothetical protein RL685_3126 [Pseudomonadota bacterium]|jgi:formylglycine-generating enzyme required for sulfatase activity